MKLTKYISLGILLILSSILNAQEKYSNDVYGFQLVFPDDFVNKTEDREKMDVISLNCYHNSMIFLASCFDYKKEIPNDELNLKEVEALALTADSFNSKFKAKKIGQWKVGKYEGLSTPIKGKVKSADGKRMTFYGYMYALAIKDGVEYRLTILAPSKKAFNETKAKAYVESFKISE
ncbi:MAG: hypothetical protein ACI857_003278 [Arenicella sp.]|jgi:hypothetical protein